MKKREFNKIIRSLVNKKTKLIDKSKAAALSHDEKDSIMKFLVRERQPVMVEFINSDADFSWLNCMGYMYRTTGKFDFTFLHTCEHIIRK